MSRLCSNAVTRERHEIADGDRTIAVTIAVDWGADDARNASEKTIPFCSFQCLADYATDRARAHDGVVLAETE